MKGNKRRAEQLLREKLTEYEQQTQQPHSDILFADYIRHWLPIIKRKVDEVTYQGYEVLANSQLLPYFDTSGIKLDSVTKDVLQTYMDALYGLRRSELLGLQWNSIDFSGGKITIRHTVSMVTKPVYNEKCQ